MYDKLARKAIGAAIANEWSRALEINLEILELNPENINALNRASRASIETGNIKKAQEYAYKVLEIDPMNTIALKCVDKCNTLQNSPIEAEELLNKPMKPVDQLFLEEPGKTKIVSLINLCEEHILAHLNTGDPVMMQNGHHKVSILTSRERYIGRLPDDVSMRIIYLVNNGNTYKSFIKSVSPEGVSIFIREQSRSNEMTNIVSFPAKN